MVNKSPMSDNGIGDILFFSGRFNCISVYIEKTISGLYQENTVIVRMHKTNKICGIIFA